LISEVRIGLAANALCVRLDGAQLIDQLRAGDASVALVVGGTEVRVVPIDRGWIAIESIVEIQVPFDRMGIAGDADFPIAIQVRDRSDSIVEAVPHGRFWTVSVSQTHDWQT
jgi:hypothetical protein